MSTINEALDEVASEFDLLGDWEAQYGYVIDLGRTLAPLSDAERIDANKVRGCASQVWLVTEPQADGTVVFRGDSDAHIVRGLVAVVLRLLSGRTPAEILAFDIKAAFERLGFSQSLSSQRTNGLASMVARIRRDAEALA
ncbi:SufE family protein [Phenylobacterium immobile]|uniref:SufE family protein n=1 Tax=Phenylobacterium immobile TaxID=21 RepID=UPI000ADF50F3|nr:SufE family protein [Phenylobacterium immobile]